MHLKRNETPKTWPLTRKGTKYVVRTLIKNSIPLLIVLRDILKLAKTRKEVRKILNSGKAKVNNKIIKEEKFPLTLFDSISLDEKNFKIILKNKKFSLIEISRKEAEKKIVKVIGKKILRKGKLQINLSDGRNFLAKDLKEGVKIGDSVVINFPDKIIETLPFKENNKVVFVRGKHLGEEGTILGTDKNIIVKVGNEKINSKLKDLMVVK